MRFARRSIGLGLLAAVNLAVIACTGGPGSADQGGDTGDQYSGVSGDDGRSAQNGSTDVPVNTGSTATATTTTTAQPPADMKASDYDQSCQSDGDCIGVVEGPVCGSCSCSNAAVNSKDYVKFAGERSTRSFQCALAGQPTSGNACSPCNTSQTAHCDANRCTYR